MIPSAAPSTSNYARDTIAHWWLAVRVGDLAALRFGYSPL